MTWTRDERYATEFNTLVYGTYLITFESDNGQARAALFRRSDGTVEAHVSFHHGTEAHTVTDVYYSPLLDYAREQGFADKFRLILS